MEKTCPSCYSCGMPLRKTEDYALGDANQKYCSHCTDALGNLKSYDEILKNTAEYLSYSQGLEMKAANELAHNLLSQQPKWCKK